MAGWYQVEFMGKNGIVVFSSSSKGPGKSSSVVIDHDACRKINRVFVVARHWTTQARRWASGTAKEMGQPCKIDIAVGSRTDVESASQRFAEGLQRGT